MKRILLIDADDRFRDALTRALSYEGHRVEAASSPEAAGDRWASLEPEVVILGEGGEAGLARVREAAVGARIIGLSAGSADGDPGFETCIPRPVDMERLRRLLREPSGADGAAEIGLETH